MVHLNITFPDDLKLALDSQAKKEHAKRSTMIQKAVRMYLDFQRKKTVIQLMKEGYQEMAAESRLLMKEFESLDRESLKYVD